MTTKTKDELKKEEELAEQAKLDAKADTKAKADAKANAKTKANAKADAEAKAKAENDAKEIKMTQAQFDANIKKRLARQAKNEFGDYDQLKEDSEKLAKIKEGELTELEKLNKDLETSREEGKKKDETFKDKTLKATIKQKATALGFKDPEYVLFKVEKNENVKIDNDYEVSGVDEALEALAESSPDLIDKKKSKIKPTNPGGGAISGESDDERRARIHGTSQDVFNPESAKEHGGGVFLPEMETPKE